MTRIDQQLAQAADDIALTLPALPDVLRRLRDGMAGQPGAQSYDTPRVSGHTTVSDEHDIPMPSVSDPTGEAAITAAAGADAATNSHRRIRSAVAIIARKADELVREVNAVQRRGPTLKERTETDGDNRIPGCEVCAKHGAWVEPIVDSSTANDNLERPYRLCRWHHDFATEHHRLPDEREEGLHQQGKRVTVRQTDRLRHGIKAGRL